MVSLFSFIHRNLILTKRHCFFYQSESVYEQKFRMNIMTVHLFALTFYYQCYYLLSLLFSFLHVATIIYLEIVYYVQRKQVHFSHLTII